MTFRAEKREMGKAPIPLGEAATFEEASRFDNVTHVLSNDDGPWVIWMRDLSRCAHPRDRPGWIFLGRAEAQ